MSYRQLAEGATNLIIDYIQANIGAQLDLVGSLVGLPQMTLENPVKYFIYPKPQGYRLPAVFVICDNMDFRIGDKKANFVNAKDKFMISILVEDQDEEILTYKAWRYQSALHAVLDEANIVSSDNTLKLTVVVYNSTFSPIFSRTESGGEGAQFRKEIVLQCEVEHMENF